jgi:radical SAM superfamily enzyme YgiQ (UPF0313 family)
MNRISCGWYVSQAEPSLSDVKQKIKKRIVPILPPPPKHFVVPLIDVVQNRVAIEILRGCTRGCRFCQAGFVTRRFASARSSKLLNQLKTSVNETGHEEIAFIIAFHHLTTRKSNRCFEIT